MACWSADNAINAYLKTLRMGQYAKEPDVSEFISAIAAGHSAQLMVVACASDANSTVLALVAAAHQTGGRVVCILRNHDELLLSQKALGLDACHVEFVIGDAQNLVSTHYSDADFVLVDCELETHEDILKAAQAGRKHNGAVVVGYNAFSKGSWRSGRSETQLLPIGGGLLVTRIAANARIGGCGYGKRSRWIVKVDKLTGEEHVFMVRLPQEKPITA